jgi:hypothetical protein
VEKKEVETGISEKVQADMTPYIIRQQKKEYSTRKGNVYYYEGLPAIIAEKLMTGQPNIDPEDTENWSPKAKEMIQIAKEHDGELIGRVSTRPDEEMRITVTGFEIKVTDYAARKIRKELTERDNGPDEFIKVRRRRGIVWRFWWS